MKNLKFSLLLLTTCFSSITMAIDTKDIVKAADHYRLASENIQVENLITTYSKEGVQEKERSYIVFTQANRQSLVLMQSPAEKGQKVLMLGDEFWMVMPTSQRPLRITPMQKLLGDASVGDIATLSWSNDYEANLIAEEKCDAQACIHLSLTARHKSSAYQRIELWVGKTKYEPLKADLYVQSDKLAKSAIFVLDKNNRQQIGEMILQDKLSTQKETRIRYLARKEKTIPASWLNPMFLAKNPQLD